jgi:hypothetical protein
MEREQPFGDERKQGVNLFLINIDRYYRDQEAICLALPQTRMLSR